MQVSFFKNALDKEGVVVDLMPILEGIRDGRWEKPIEYLRSLPKDKYDTEKKYLPAATFSGTFAPSRLDQNLKSYTGIMVLDLDHIGDTLQEAKEKISKSPNVLAAFISPSNDGLKILMLIDTPSDLHGESFDWISKDIKSHIGIAMDASGRNVSRLCFVSHDENIYINTDAVPMKLSEVVKKATGTPLPDRSKANSNNPKVIMAERITRAKHSYIKGHRNEYIHYLSCCLNRLGVDFSEAHDYIVSNYDLELSEMKPTIKSGYRHKHEFNKWTIEDIEKAPPITREHFESSFRAESLGDILSVFIKDVGMGSGPRTYIEDIDREIGNLERGNLYGMIGRDGTFKSILAMHLCLENAKAGVASIYFNLEMSRIQFAQRVIMKECDVNIIKEKRDGRMNEQAKDAVIQRLSEIEKNMIIVSDDNIPYSTMEQSIRKEIAKRGDLDIQLIIIDGISSMADETNIGDIFAATKNSQNLKELAKNMNAAIVCICHTKSDCPKHIRNTGPFARGGIKITANMDGYFCHSLLIDPITNESMGEDIIYREGMFYMKFIDKRGSAPEINKIITIGDNIKVDVTDLNPSDYEIKLKR